MGCKIIFAPQAIADLAEIVRFIAKDDPESARRIGDALIDRVAILENFPLLGSPYPKRPGVRKLVFQALSYLFVALFPIKSAWTSSGTGILHKNNRQSWGKERETRSPIQ